ncbi:hypothetical protein F5877DRAFT_82381 [Lentinula edodes]|nr:hypothetical protein F5877DRAFT_82381 [Lentinula edodes]
MRFLAVLTSMSAVILLMAGKASAVANSALNACNCPNNCGYKVDSSCKYDHSIGIEDVTISGSKLATGLTLITIGWTNDNSL